MKKVILSLPLFFIAINGLVGAKEVISDFDSNSLPVLNETLRTIELDIESLKSWSFERTPDTVIITGGVITINQAVNAVDTEAAAASDNLDTVNGGSEGNLAVFYPANAARTVVFKDGTGNLKLAGDFTADNSEDTITLVKVGLNWREVARSNNGA